MSRLRRQAYINVGGSHLDGYDGTGGDAKYASGKVFGLGLTDHSGDMNDDYATSGNHYESGFEDNMYSWSNISAGYLYEDALFSTGVYEGYGDARGASNDGGLDPFGGDNNSPVHIAEFGAKLGYQGDVAWTHHGKIAVDENGTDVASDGKIHDVYEVNAVISLAALNVKGGDSLDLWWTMECGNDFFHIQATVPDTYTPQSAAVPEPGTLLLLGIGLLGIVGIKRKR